MFADPLRSLGVQAPHPRTVAGRAESAQYFFRDGVHELVVLARGVTGEIEAVDHGPAEFALVEEEPLLLLCHRFDDAIPWSLATYCPHAAPVRDRAGMPVEDGHTSRAFLHVRLVAAGRDSDNDLARRNVTLSLEFTRALCAALRDQTRFLSDPVAQRRALQKLRRRYPTTEALVGHASARTIGSR
jgi:hypothetical protein